VEHYRQVVLNDSAFRVAYYQTVIDAIWEYNQWMGVPTLKLPFDLWVYQEILYETRPNNGNWHG
jgi:cephalosporin hydroxylase